MMRKFLDFIIPIVIAILCIIGLVLTIKYAYDVGIFPLNDCPFPHQGTCL